jgi:hypothetical protein
MYSTKGEELNLLFQEQNLELHRAANLSQNQKDVELIVQRHMVKVNDWL